MNVRVGRAGEEGGETERKGAKGSPEVQQGGRSIIGVSTAAHKY